MPLRCIRRPPLTTPPAPPPPALTRTRAHQCRGRNFAGRRVCFSSLAWAASTPDSHIWDRFSEPQPCTTCPQLRRYAEYVAERWGQANVFPRAYRSDACRAAKSAPATAALPALAAHGPVVVPAPGDAAAAAGGDGSTCKPYVQIVYVQRKKKPFSSEPVQRRTVANDAEFIDALRAAASDLVRARRAWCRACARAPAWCRGVAARVGAGARTSWGARALAPLLRQLPADGATGPRVCVASPRRWSERRRLPPLPPPPPAPLLCDFQADVDVVVADFTPTPYEQQMRVARASHIMIGMHGAGERLQRWDSGVCLRRVRVSCQPPARVIDPPAPPRPPPPPPPSPPIPPPPCPFLAGMVHGLDQADTDECGGRTSLIELFPLPNEEKGVRNMNVQVGRNYLTWHNEDASKETDVGTLVDLAAIRELVRGAVEALLAARKC